MAVFRVEKTKDYTIMSNHHLKDKTLTLRAKGLLSLMLSLPEKWTFTLKGLACISLEGVDAIRAAIQELERQGYIVRRQTRDAKGKLAGVEYVIFEQPQPLLENPTPENPIAGTPITDMSVSEHPTQLITKEVSKDKEITDIENIHQSVYPAGDKAIPPQKDGLMDRIGEIATYRELIQANIEYDCLCGQYGRERMDEIVEIMLDAICSKRPYLRIGGEDKPAEVVKSRLLKIDQYHIEYAFNCLDKNTTKIHNIRAYLLTTLYNTPVSIDHFYRAAVQHDMYGT